MSGPDGRAIDTHAHIYPAEYLDLLEEIGVPAAGTAIARGIGADSTDADLSARLRWMDSANVETQVIAVTPQSPSGPQGSSSLAAARRINDEYATFVRRHPAASSPTVPSPSPTWRSPSPRSRVCSTNSDAWASP